MSRRFPLAIVLVLLASAAWAEGASIRADVARRAPVASPPDLSAADADPGRSGVQVLPKSGEVLAVAVSIGVEDDNGHNDVAEASVRVYKADGRTLHAAANASKAGATGKRATWTASFPMAHSDPPGTYHVRVEAKDRDGDASIAVSNFTYESLAAIGGDASTVLLNPGGAPDAALAPGASSHGAPSSVVLTNEGNVPVGLEYSGTHLANATSGAKVDVGNVHLALAEGMADELPLGLQAARHPDLSLAPGSAGATLYFAAHAPVGIPAGSYAGELTLVGVPDSGP